MLKRGAFLFVVMSSGCTGGAGSLPVDQSSSGGGSSSGTTTNPAVNAPPNSAAQEQAYCDMLANRQCGGGGSSECSKDGKCLAGKMSPAAATAYNNCRSAPSCKGDDACIAQAGSEVGGAAADAYASKCSAKRSSCPALKGDYCSPAVFAYSGIADAIAGCLDQPCEQVMGCIENAATPLSACK